jgi:hypothetical protein
LRAVSVSCHSVKVKEKRAHPFKTLVETVTGGSTGGLDVPCSLTERVETKFVGNLGGVHGVGQILHVSEVRIDAQYSVE